MYSTYDIINNIVKRLGRKNHIPHTSIPNTSSKIVITSTNNNTEGNFLKTSSTKNDTEGNIRRLPPLRRDGAINNNWRAWMIIMIDTKMENIVGGIRYQMTIYSNGLRRLKIVPFVSSLCHHWYQGRYIWIVVGKRYAADASMHPSTMIRAMWWRNVHFAYLWPSETKCPFCRTPAPSSNEETLERYKKRAEIGDAEAIRSLACFYRDGTLGLPQDNDKVFELFVRAGELGCAGACNNVGYAYENGTGVERDAKKARHYFKLAAMRGGCNSKA